MLVQGVVWPADQAQLRADEDGFVVALLAADGEVGEAKAPGAATVQPGAAAPGWNANARGSRHSKPSSCTRLPGDGAGAGNARAEWAAAQAELDRLQERVSLLQLRAHSGGRVALPAAADLPGQYVRRGQLLGQVVGSDAGSVRLALPEA